MAANEPIHVFPKFLSTSTSYTILPKPLPTLPNNHHRNMRERNLYIGTITDKDDFYLFLHLNLT